MDLSTWIANWIVIQFCIRITKQDKEVRELFGHRHCRGTASISFSHNKQSTSRKAAYQFDPAFLPPTFTFTLSIFCYPGGNTYRLSIVILQCLRWILSESWSSVSTGVMFRRLILTTLLGIVTIFSLVVLGICASWILKNKGYISPLIRLETGSSVASALTLLIMLVHPEIKRVTSLITCDQANYRCCDEEGCYL